MTKLKKLNIAILLVLLLFQTILSPISVFANEIDPLTNGDTAQPIANVAEGEAVPTGNLTEPVGDVAKGVATTQALAEPVADVVEEEVVTTEKPIQSVAKTAKEEATPTGNLSALLPNASSKKVTSTSKLNMLIANGSGNLLTSGSDGFTISNVTIKQDGQVAPPNLTFTGTPNELKAKEYIVSFDFNLTGGHNVKPGDYFQFTVPTAFKLNPITVPNEIVDKNGVVVATWTSDSNGNVKIVFAGAVYDADSGGQPVDDGKFEYEWGLDASKLTELGSNEFKFNIAGEKTLNLIVNNPYNGADLVKSTGTHTKNSSTVSWTVDINKGLKDIGGKKLTDSLAASATDIKLTELKPKLNSSGGVDFTSDTSTEQSISFPHTFDSGDSKAYRLTYRTTVSDTHREEVVTANGSKTFNNYNTISLGDFSPASASVNLKFDTPITKLAQAINPTDGSKSLIKWTIEVNADGRDISKGVTIKDTLTSSGTSTDGKIMALDESAGKAPSVDNGGTLAYSKNAGNPTFTLTPASGKETGKYTITYYTYDDVVDKAYSVSNNAVISYDSSVTTKTYSDNASANVGVQMFTKSGTNTGNIDYLNKKFDWTIGFNTSGYKDLTNVVITDTFESGKYLKMYKKDFPTGNLCTTEKTTDCFELSLIDPQTDASGEYTLKGFTLTGKGTINGQKTFKYPTYFDPTQVYANNNVKNTGQVAWTKSTINYSNSITATTTFNTFTGKNGYKSGLYNPIDKSVEWELDINYNLYSLKNPTVTDTFANQQTMKTVDKTTVKVYLLDLQSSNQDPTVNSPYTNYTVTGTGAPGAYTGFTLTFGDTITQPYRIEYTTEYDDKFIHDAKIHNSAYVTIEGDTTTKYAELNTVDLNEGVTPTNHNQYMSKDGKDIDKTDYLIWTLKVNASQSYIKVGSTITDTLNGGQVLVTDQSVIPVLAANKIPAEYAALLNETFLVQKRVYARSGDTFSSSLETVNATDIFDIAYVKNAENEVTGFTLTLKNDINHEYLVSYMTDISGADTGATRPSSLSNTYSYVFEGNGKEEDSDSKSVNVTYQRANASATLSRYTLELEKVDENNAALEDVEFGLYVSTQNGLKLLKSAITDTTGKADFGEIKYGSYVIKEITPATGYTSDFLVNEAGGYVSQYAFTTAGKTKELSYKLKNQKRNQTVTITNTSSCQGPVEGSKFVVYKKDTDGSYKPYKGTEQDSTLTTDANGKIVIGIDADGKSNIFTTGDYKIIQTSTVDGLTINNSEETFSITDNQTVPVEINILNECNYCPQFSLTIMGVTEGKSVSLKANAEVIDLGTTDATGKVIAANPVTHGTYDVFVENVLVGKVTVDKSKCNVTIPLPNTCEVTFINKDKLTNTDVKASSEYKVIDENGVVSVESITSDTDGNIVVPKLPPGKYELVQVKTPTGYLPTTDPVEFTVNENLSGTCNVTVEEIEVEPTDACPVFTLTVQNVNGVARPGVTVTIKDSTGVNTIATATTDALGIATVPYMIEPGTYRVYEGAALLGTITVDSTCNALVKPFYTGGGGGGWVPPVDPENPKPENPDPEKPVDPENPNPEKPEPGKPTNPSKPGEKPEDKDPLKPIIDKVPPIKETISSKPEDKKDLQNKIDELEEFLKEYNKLTKDQQAEIDKLIDMGLLNRTYEDLLKLLNQWDKLPQTDGASQTTTALIGLLLVAISGTLLFVRRRKTA